jgi:hypothetical protein
MGLLHLWVRVRTAPREGGGADGGFGRADRLRAILGHLVRKGARELQSEPPPRAIPMANRAPRVGDTWPRAASVRSRCDVLRAARGRRWELQPCDQTRAIVWCPVDGAREGFSTSHRLGQSPWRLGKRGRQRHRVGHTHLVRGNVEPAAPSHPRREPCASACQAEARCTVVQPLQACVRDATSCEQR